MTYATLIDLISPILVRVINFEVDDTGCKSIIAIYDHGVEAGTEVTLDMLIEDATTEPLEWEWSGEYLGNVDVLAQAFQNNYRKLQLIDQLKELLEAEEELAAQLADCRAHIKRVRGAL